MSSHCFDIDVCTAALGSGANVFLLHALAECDSTNVQLMQLAEAGAKTGTVLVADSQTAGRGRRSRVWISSPQESLTFSLLWRFAPESSAPEALSLVVGLALQRALTTFGIKAAVKWPNDILCKGRKLAGVLIEAQPGDIKSTVIGVGINLSLPRDMPEDIARTAIALDEVLDPVPRREHLLVALLNELGATLRRYEAEGFAGLREVWQRQHALHGCNVRISGGAEDIEGICSGVTDHGELLVSTAHGVRRVISGDVSLRAA